MNQILTLREKRANLWNETKAFLDAHRGEDGMVSAEDNATYEKMESDVVALGKEIERLERQVVIDRELDRPTSAPLVSTPAARTPEKKAGRSSNEYMQAFWNQMRGRSTYEVRNALQVGELSEGGYTVPDEFERQLIEGLEDGQTWVAYDNATLTTALNLAGAKKRVFVAQPTPPYDVDDLWAGGSASDMKVCVTAKAASGSYSANDWGLASASVVDLSIGGRNLIQRTLSPSPTMATGTRPSVNGVAEAVFSGSTSFYPDLHGIRIVANTAVRPYIRFGSNSAADMDMLGLVAGETYTFSCDAEVKLLSGTQNSTQYNAYAYLYHASSASGSYTGGTLAAGTAYQVCAYPQSAKGTVQANRVEWTFTIPSDAVACYLFIACNRTTASNYAAGDYITLSNLKLEKGDKATDWTPAPEDVADAFHANETALDTYKNAVTARFETAEGLISAKVSQTSYDEQMQIVDGRMTRIEGRAESVEAEVRTLYGENSSLLRLDTEGLHMQQNQVDKYELLMQADKLSYLRRETGDAVAVFGAEGVFADRLRSNKTLSVGSATEGWYDFSILRTGMAEKWRTVEGYETAFAIVTQPVNVTGTNSAVLRVTAVGNSLAYKWQYSNTGGATWANVSGGTSSTYTVSLTSATAAVYLYRCKITNTDGGGGTVTKYSNPVSVFSSSAPVPYAISRNGSTLTVLTYGTPSGYQWQSRSGASAAWADISGATAASLTITSATYAYRCKVVGNSCYNVSEEFIL